MRPWLSPWFVLFVAAGLSLRFLFFRRRYTVISITIGLAGLIFALRMSNRILKIICYSFCYRGPYNAA
ncbi:MAG: hypothetical protein HPY66_2359 [Firmicutes bacterium]|nr:hypothetical protein [Bacillota bacterium]